MSTDTEYIRRGCIAVLTESAGKAQRAISEVGSGWKPILAELPAGIDKIEADCREAYAEIEKCTDALIRLRALREAVDDQH